MTHHLPFKLPKLSVKDLVHFVATFVASFLTVWLASHQPLSASALESLVPAAVALAWHRTFPVKPKLFVAPSPSFVSPSVVTPPFQPVSPTVTPPTANTATATVVVTPVVSQSPPPPPPNTAA